MRNFKTLLVIMAVVSVLASCSTGGGGDDFSGDYGDIKVSDTRLLQQKVEYSESPLNVDFTANAAWSTRISAVNGTSTEWISISQTKGEAGSYSMGITLQKNETNSSRSAAIQIICDKSQLDILVTQLSENGEEDPVEENPDDKYCYVINKIEGYDSANVKKCQMDFDWEQINIADNYDLRIKSFKASLPDSKGNLTLSDEYAFTYNVAENMIDYEYNCYVGDRHSTNATIDRDGCNFTTVFPDSGKEVSGWYKCFYGTGVFNSDKLVKIERYGYNGEGVSIDEYVWEQDAYGPVEAWDNCASAKKSTFDGNEMKVDMEQKYTFDYTNSLRLRDFMVDLRVGKNVYIDPSLLLVAESDYLRAMGFFGSENQNLFSSVETKVGDKTTTQAFEYSKQNFTVGQDIVDPLAITCRTKHGDSESVIIYRVQFKKVAVQ